MRTMRREHLAGSFVLLFVLGLCVSTATAADAPRMTIEDLKGRLGEPGLTLIDVRRAGDWDQGETKIKTATRRDPTSFRQWKTEVPRDATIVLYCA